MRRMLCIIPPDYEKNNDIYQYELKNGEFHDELLLNYCYSNQLEYNDITSCVINNYVYVSSFGSLYICFIPIKLGDEQEYKLLSFFKQEYCLNKNLEIKFGIITKDSIIKSENKITNYEDLKNYLITNKIGGNVKC